MKKLAISLMLVSSLTIGNVFAGTITGKVSTTRLKTPKDILVYIEEIAGQEFTPPEEPVKMDQISLVFVPRVLPLLKGTSVEFLNNDDLKHNVFGVGDDDFDLGTWGKGGVETYSFDKLGEVAILCNVHPEMEAYVIVLQNPYFGFSDEEGNYQIENVPAGTHTLKTWHDRLRPVTQQVEVSDSGRVNRDFELKR